MTGSTGWAKMLWKRCRCSALSTVPQRSMRSSFMVSRSTSDMGSSHNRVPCFQGLPDNARHVMR